MRSVVYKNLSYPGYSKTMFGTVDGWGQFLNTIGAGHEFNSADLRTIPGSVLLAKLKPMLYDTDLAFTLEYSDSNVVKEVQVLAEESESYAPRQSGAYLISRAFAGVRLLRNDGGGKSAALDKAGKRNLQIILGYLKEALQEWNSLKSLQAADYAYADTNDSDDFWPAEPTVKAIIDDTVKEVEGYAGTTGLPETFFNWRDGSGNTWELLRDTMTLKRCDAVSVLEEDDPRYEYYDILKATPGPVYTSSSSEAVAFRESVQALIAFISDYCTYVRKFLKTDESGAVLNSTGIIIRFYPQNVLLTEPLRQIETVPLSENSFIQVGKPQQNMVATFVNNMALDTPDTQWREIYAKIFNIISGHGNPACKARIGRYLLEDCYLMTVPDLTQSTNSAPVFSFNLISKHWDSGKLSAINFVG